MLLLKHLKKIHGGGTACIVLTFFAFVSSLSCQCFAQFRQTHENSIVMILTVKQEYDYSSPWKKGPMARGSGSGFIIEGNRILTNAHNVADQRYIEVKKQNFAQRYPATVQFVGHDCDLAIITVPDPRFFEGTEPLTFGGLPKVNSTVQTYGFPVGGSQISSTEGVVSRLETAVYTHSQGSQHLVVQSDAAINPGNSGGPVLQNGKVVGVAFQGLTAAENIGYLIPTTIIEHFLKDVEDGVYNGFGKFGITLFPGLHNSDYKKYLKIPNGEDGVVVIDVLRNSTSYGILESEDVITQIDDFNIDNDGRVFIDGLSLELSEVMDRKQIGETVKITHYRDGEKLTSDLIISSNEKIIPWDRLYDLQPEYRIFAGLTFVQLNRNFLEKWGNNWVADMPFSLRYLFINSNQLNQDPDRKEYIVLSEILSDDVNAYLDVYQNRVVESVNNIPINELEDMDTAFQKDLNGFWVVKFIGTDTPMVIDAEEARKRHLDILKKYQVPTETTDNEEEDFLF